MGRPEHSLMRSSCGAATLRLALVLLALGCALGVPTHALSQELPAQDNDLVIGAAAGAFIAPEAKPLGDEYRLGTSLDLFVGLSNRGTSWLDAELSIGFTALLLAEGFEQTVGDRGGERILLPGVRLRGGVRLIPGAVRFGTGFAVSILAAPYEGSFTRLLLDASIGYELWREPDEHFGLDLAYVFPVYDGLTNEPGLAFRDYVHTVVLQAVFGF